MTARAPPLAILRSVRLENVSSFFFFSLVALYVLRSNNTLRPPSNNQLSLVLQHRSSMKLSFKGVWNNFRKQILLPTNAEAADSEYEGKRNTEEARVEEL